MGSIDLELRIIWQSGRQYQALIIRSPHGVGTHVPFTVSEGSSLLAEPEGGDSELSRDLRPKKPQADLSPLELLKKQGAELFGLVFQGENREPFQKCLKDAQERGEWLRLRLSFKDAPAAADWPWEAMVVEWTGQFLANMPRVSFERTHWLENPTIPASVAHEAVLRILFVGASPKGQAPLRVLKEQRLVAKVFRQAGVPVKPKNATSRKTFDKMTASKIPFEIIHVTCHGDFENNEGGLWLEGLLEGGDRLSSPELSGFLRRLPALVFLNACHSGRGAHDPFAGLVESLLRAGTAAVVAMRQPISDAGAVQLAEGFYQHLAGGETVARSLAKWRETSSRDDADWAVPVLYLAGEDLSVWVPPPVPIPEPQPPPPRPKRHWLWIALAALVAGAALGLWSWLDPPDPVCEKPSVKSDPRCPAPAGLDLPMVFIQKGSFDQGSTTGEKDERPVHPVTLTQDFCIGAFEVAQGLYARVMGLAEVPVPQANFPVESATWDNAKQFAQKLEERIPGAGFRLPTNAQWEFAARAGLTGDEDPATAAAANCSGRSAGDPYRHVSAAGCFQKNAWGLYDMKGNVWEWVEDWEEPYRVGPVEDPRGPATGEAKIRRGGSYKSVPRNCRISTRNGVQPERKQEAAGFRIVRDPVPMP